MNKMIDLTGLRFGSLTVIKHSPRKTKGCANSQWVCQCDCGRYLIVRSDNLRKGRTTQCSQCGSGGGVPSVFCNEDGEDYGVV